MLIQEKPFQNQNDSDVNYIKQMEKFSPRLNDQESKCISIETPLDSFMVHETRK